MTKVLIADDDKNLASVLMGELLEEGFQVDKAESGTKTMDLLEKYEYDVLLLDLTMPGIGGIDVLRKLKALGLSTEVVILTGNATIPTAVEAMKLGAYDYLTKPFKMAELKLVLQKANEKKELLAENFVLKAQVKRQTQAITINTKSPSMLEVLENVQKVAVSDFPVLLQGESGVGKELMAKAIHRASKRSDGPFIPINCGAIPENMLESELFGHEKGAFTGAHARKLGLLEIANHGILFLDEITELNPTLQGKLLRVIETGTFFRVGGTLEVSVDIKFVSATNKDLRSEIEKGSFRLDLYYRVSTLTLPIPPLRERKEDIPLLIGHIIKTNHAFKNKEFSAEALNVLLEYAWPGNVRELQNVIHQTLLLSKKDIIQPYDLPSSLGPVSKVSGRRLEDVEREHILMVLRETGGQKTKTAEILGIDPKTLYRKLLNYGLDNDHS